MSTNPVSRVQLINQHLAQIILHTDLLSIPNALPCCVIGCVAVSMAGFHTLYISKACRYVRFTTPSVNKSRDYATDYFSNRVDFLFRATNSVSIVDTNRHNREKICVMILQKRVNFLACKLDKNMVSWYETNS